MWRCFLAAQWKRAEQNAVKTSFCYSPFLVTSSHFLGGNPFDVFILFRSFAVRLVLFLFRHNFNLCIPVMEEVVQQGVDCFQEHVHQKHHRNFFQQIVEEGRILPGFCVAGTPGRLPLFLFHFRNHGIIGRGFRQLPYYGS